MKICEPGAHQPRVDLLMKKIFGEKNFKLLKEIGQVTQNKGFTAYLVGGPVRDLLLSKLSKPRTRRVQGKDLDIVISDGEKLEKNTAINLAKKLFKIWQKKEKRIKFKTHQRFGTATILFPLGGNQLLEIDFVFSRKEKYLSPGGLPEVESGNIEDDLYRRDFTINALAVNLSSDKFGELVDSTGGKNDLKKKFIRVLHEKSFLDDPTRILRAARFAGRYNFSFERKTLTWLKKAIKKNVLSTISRQRFREEMVNILKEKESACCLNLLADWSVLSFLSPDIRWDKTKTVDYKMERGDKDWLVGLLLLIKDLDYQKTEEIARRMVLTRKERKIILQSKKFLPDVLKALEKNYSLVHLYRYLFLLPEQGLVYLQVINSRWTNLIDTFRRRKDKAKPVLNGEDLKKIGYPPGPIYKKILKKIFQVKLSGKLPTYLPVKQIKEKEIEFVLRYYPLKGVTANERA